MKGQRKKLKEKIDFMESLKDHTYKRKDIMTSYSEEKQFDAIIQHYDEIIKSLRQKMMPLPTAHKYVGTFYVRTAYVSPPSSIEVIGHAIMSEDCVSWFVDAGNNNEIIQERIQFRNIFRDKDMEIPIQREEGLAMFENPTTDTVT